MLPSEKRIIAILLCMCMAATLLPAISMPAHAAAGDAIQYGTDVLKTNMNTINAATVYFGQYSGSPIAWRVIGYGDEVDGLAGLSGNMTLITSGLPLRSMFDENGVSHEYANSILKTNIDGIADSFSTKEKAAITARTLSSGTYNTVNPFETDCVVGNEVTGALLWPLSTKEASSMDAEIRNISAAWWLRSPGSNMKYAAAVKRVDGSVYPSGNTVDINSFVVRPTFHSNLSSVLFTSAAIDGKPDAVNSAIPLAPTEWKLTLKDTSRAFAITGTPTVNGKKLPSAIQERSPEAMSISPLTSRTTQEILAITAD